MCTDVTCKDNAWTPQASLEFQTVSLTLIPCLTYIRWHTYDMIINNTTILQLSVSSSSKSLLVWFFLDLSAVRSSEYDCRQCRCEIGPIDRIEYPDSWDVSSADSSYDTPPPQERMQSTTATRVWGTAMRMLACLTQKSLKLWQLSAAKNMMLIMSLCGSQPRKKSWHICLVLYILYDSLNTQAIQAKCGLCEATTKLAHRLLRAGPSRLGLVTELSTRNRSATWLCLAINITREKDERRMKMNLGYPGQENFRKVWHYYSKAP